MKVFNYVDTALVFFVPLTSIIVLNTFTGYTVWRVAGVRRTMTTHKRWVFLCIQFTVSISPSFVACTVYTPYPFKRKVRD